MIKNILTLILGMVIASPSLAQVDFGLKGGLNIVNNKTVGPTPEYTDNRKFRPSYHLGVFTIIPFKDRFFVQPEFLFSNKGFKFAPKNGRDAGNLHLNYLNLPILIGYQPVERLNLLLGSEIGYLLTAKTKRDSRTEDVSIFWNNKFDFALAVGISYSIIEKINVGLRYNHGFSSVIKDIFVRDKFGQLTDQKVKLQNRTFQLSLGYKIK